MVYAEVVVDVHIQNHFNLVVVELEGRLPGKFQNPHIEKVWADRLNHNEVLYQVHVKTGHIGNHHHFTVLFETRHGHAKILNVEEGHKTLF